MSQTVAPAAQSSGHRSKLGPYSRRLHRGAVGDSIDGRSALGRFIRNLEAELIAHCGGSPSITQKMLIDQAIQLRLQRDALIEKRASGGWTPHDGRAYGALLNAYRLTIRELGLKGTPPRVPTLAELFPDPPADRAA